MAVTVTHSVVATGTNDGTKQVSKDAWNNGHVITGGVSAASITLTPSNLTGSVTLPAGAVLVDIIVNVSALWNGSALLNVGDGASANGFIAGLGLTTLVVGGWSLIGDVTSNSYALSEGVYAPSSTLGVQKRAYPSGGVITATVTATAPTVGSTTIVVLYAVPA